MEPPPSSIYQRVIKDSGLSLRYVIVDEAGASVYSASDGARGFADLTYHKGAVSTAAAVKTLWLELEDRSQIYRVGLPA